MLNLSKYKLYRLLHGGEWYRYKVIRKKWFNPEFIIYEFWTQNHDLAFENDRRQVIIIDIERYDSRF
jgi:hypothetical protein